MTDCHGGGSVFGNLWTKVKLFQQTNTGIFKVGFFPIIFSRKQTFWFDGEEYIQYGFWYSCCNSCLINSYDLCTCQKCQKVRPSGNRKADVWRSTDGGPWLSENGKMSTPSKMFSSSFWSSSVESRNNDHWRQTLGSLHETSQTTLSDIWRLIYVYMYYCDCCQIFLCIDPKDFLIRLPIYILQLLFEYWC